MPGSRRDNRSRQGSDYRVVLYNYRNPKPFYLLSPLLIESFQSCCKSVRSYFGNSQRLTIPKYLQIMWNIGTRLCSLSSSDIQLLFCNL